MFSLRKCVTVWDMTWTTTLKAAPWTKTMHGTRMGPGGTRMGPGWDPASKRWETEAPQARRQKNDLASSSPVVSLAGSLVAEQAFNYRPGHVVVTTSVRQDVGWARCGADAVHEAPRRKRVTAHLGNTPT